MDSVLETMKGLNPFHVKKVFKWKQGHEEDKWAEKAVDAYEDFFELTHQGEALNLNEFATWIADTRDV